MALEMVAITLGENPIAIAFRFVPLTLIDVLVEVDHAAFALRHSIYPVSVVPISILVKECATAMLFVFKPIACVLTTMLLVLGAPMCALTVTFVD